MQDTGTWLADYSLPMRFAITYHIEGPRSRPSLEIYQEISRQVVLADALRFDYAWFAEHHAHIHLGHLPCPLLLALHLASQTSRIELGTAVICLNMHNAVEVAEQVAVADLLTGGRISPGFGSGSTLEELDLYELPGADAATRHRAFEASLGTIRDVWAGKGPEKTEGAGPRYGPPLPVARGDLLGRSWVAANSPEAAGIAARGGHHLMLSFLRTPAQYAMLRQAYVEAGGKGRVAANRPVYVAADEATAWREAEPALRILWRRFVEEGKIPRDRPEPREFDLTNTPGQFVVGSPATVVRFIRDLHTQVPFDTFNLEPRWEGFTPAQVEASLRLFAEHVIPSFAGG